MTYQRHEIPEPLIGELTIERFERKRTNLRTPIVAAIGVLFVVLYVAGYLQ